MANLTIPAGTKIAFRAGKTKDQAVADKIANQIANLNLCTTKELYINGERVGLTDAEATKLAGSASSGDLTALTNRVTAVEQKNTQQDNSINGLTTRVGTAEGNITSLTTRVGTAEGTIKTQGSQIESLANRATNIEKKNIDQDTAIKAAQDKADANGLAIDTLETADQNLYARVTAPFDGFVESGTVLEMSAISYTRIVFVKSAKKFAAESDGKYYGGWNAKDGRVPQLYGPVPSFKKLYLYNGEVYTFDADGNGLVLAHTLLQVTGADQTRAMSQAAVTTQLNLRYTKSEADGKFAALAAFNALVTRVAALEAQLKLA